MLESGILRTLSFIGIVASFATMVWVTSKPTKKWLKWLFVVLSVAAMLAFAAACANASAVPPVQPPVRDVEYVQGGSMNAVYQLQGNPAAGLQGSKVTLQ